MPALSEPTPEDAAAGPVSDRLLDAALVCFRKLGTARTRIEDIAAEAGIARTAVYRHFQNKRAIVAALAARWLAEDEARLAAIARGPGQAIPQRLRAFLLADAQAARHHLADACRMAVLDEVARSISPVLLQHRANIRRHLAGLLAEGRIDRPEQAAQALDDLMDRFHDPRCSSGLDDTTWRARVDAAVALLLRGLQASP